MKDSIPFKTRKSSVTTSDGSTVWQGYPLLGNTVTPEQVAAQVAADTRLDIVDVKYIHEKTGSTVKSFVQEGKNVDLDWVGFTITMTGGLESSDAPFDAGRNSLQVRAHTRPPLRDCLSGVGMRNVTSGLKASLLSVMDSVAKEEGVITVTSRILAVGNNIHINVENGDEGVWLLTKKGDVAAVPQILANDASILDLSLSELPADGEYVLQVKARSGASLDFAPAVARRNITIRSNS